MLLWLSGPALRPLVSFTLVEVTGAQVWAQLHHSPERPFCLTSTGLTRLKDRHNICSCE